MPLESFPGGHGDLDLGEGKRQQWLVMIIIRWMMDRVVEVG